MGLPGSLTNMGTIKEKISDVAEIGAIIEKRDSSKYSICALSYHKKVG